MATLEGVTCATCSATVTGAAVSGAIRCGCCPAGSTAAYRSARHPTYCDDQCRYIAARRTIARISVCPHCSRAFDNGAVRDDGQVGPATSDSLPFCGEACRDAARKDRQTAIRELKRESYATGVDDLQGQLLRATSLFEFWAGRGVEPCDEPPPDGAMAGLRQRTDQLLERLSRAQAEQYAEQVARSQQTARQAYLKQVESWAKDARKWREQL